MISIHFAREPGRIGWSVYACTYINRRRAPFKITIEMLDPVDDANRIEPALSNVDDETIEALLKGLQEANLMPKMGVTEAELAATKRHLEDLRALVWEENKPK